MRKAELLEKLKERGFDQRIIAAFETIPRESFVPTRLIGQAYEDRALSLGEGSSLSQPSTIAFMLKLLEINPQSKILEIGSGSGYTISLMAEIATAGELYGIEINKALVESSTEKVKKNSRIKIYRVNGKRGFIRYAPYDRILVSASYPYIPYHLLDQLKINGVMVVPVGNSIFRLRKRIDGVSEKEHVGFSFVDIQ